MVTTWNIIFLGINLSQSTENNDSETQVIKDGIEIFRTDVDDSGFSNNLNIHMLEFISDTPAGKATLYQSENKLGKNKLQPIDKIDFNCQSQKSYHDYFERCKAKKSEDVENKYLIVFLAHSFGAGYFYTKTDNEYFSTSKLNDAIQSGFNLNDGKKIDYFFSLNCSLQSVQSNCILAKTIDYHIGSQQPMGVEMVSYKKLLYDLTYTITSGGISKNGFESETIFSKFIFNCYANFRKQIRVAAIKGEDVFDNFSLSMTRPKDALILDKKIGELAKIIKAEKDIDKYGRNDFDFLNFAAAFCDDPSFLDRANIIDARQFYSKLQTYYGEGEKLKLIKEIIFWLKQIVLINLVSPDLCQTEVDEYGSAKMYLPFGIGILIPKVLSEHFTILWEEMPIYQTEFKGLITAMLETVSWESPSKSK